MVEIPTVSQLLRQAYLRGVRDFFLDAKTSNAQVRIYSGVQPATPGGALTITEVLLATLVLDKPSGAISGDELILVSSTVTLVTNTGTATWARVVDGDGNWGLDTNVGGPGSVAANTAGIELDSVNLVAGGKVAMLSGKFQ